MQGKTFTLLLFIWSNNYINRAPLVRQLASELYDQVLENGNGDKKWRRAAEGATNIWKYGYDNTI